MDAATKVKKAIKDAFKALEAFTKQEVQDNVMNALENDPEAFMGHVRCFLLVSTDITPALPIEKLAYNSVEIYRTCARLNAMFEIKDRSIELFGCQPPFAFTDNAKIGWLLGRTNALLGVCWEDAMVSEKVRSHLAKHYYNALMNAVKHTLEAWKLIQQHLTETTP